MSGATSSWPASWLQDEARPCAMPQAWRGVETQYIAASMKLVNSFAEQDLLEQMLDEHKPLAPTPHRAQHYLLLSPFRYSPPHASRFRPANQPGIWYGAATLDGAAAEIAYWRHRFLTDSVGLIGDSLTTELTFYRSDVQGLALDLMQAPWSTLSAQWRHPSDYHATQALAAAAMQTSVQWIRYESVRAPTHALAAVLTPTALRSSRAQIERSREEWFCQTTAQRVLLRSKKGHASVSWTPESH